MTSTTKQAIIKALKANVGQAYDNLYRAEAAFRGCTPEQMAQKYGQSNRTRAEIVEGYRKWHYAAKKALEETEAAL